MCLVLQPFLPPDTMKGQQTIFIDIFIFIDVFTFKTTTTTTIKQTQSFIYSQKLVNKNLKYDRVHSL